MPDPQQPYEPERAVAGTGMGGQMDLGASEAITLEKTPESPDGTGPRTSRAASGPTPGTTCAATPSSSSRPW